jgi:virginiamycin B lyase
MKNQIAKLYMKMLALVLGIACAQAAPAQTFKNVPVKGGALLEQVSSGGASVWALAKSGKPYIYQNKQFVLANSIALTQIAVGGGSKFQADTVWGLNSSGNVYKAQLSGTTWSFTQIPGTLDFIAVAAGTTDNCHPYEVWGVNTATHIFRYNFCNKDFDQIAGLLSSVAVGGGDIWGLNSSGGIFRFNFSTGGFDQVNVAETLSQITVGPNGVWGIHSTNQIFEFYDNSQEFSQLSGILTDIQAGGNGVWGLNSAEAIFRLEPSTSTFVSVPGNLVSLSVGSGGGVWGINSSNHAYVFSTP